MESQYGSAIVLAVFLLFIGVEMLNKISFYERSGIGIVTGV